MAIAGTAAAVLVWLLVLLFFRSHRNWLPYYIIGSVGSAFLIIGLGRTLFPLETILRSLTAQSVHQIAGLVGVTTQVFPAVPGALMVLVVPQEMGWTVLNVGVESSGLLEIGVISGMVGFYPGWSLRKRLAIIALGVGATYLANLVRISFIVATLHWGGKEWLFISHTILGRLIFFALMVAIFWLIFSLPTLRTVHRRLLSRDPQ